MSQTDNILRYLKKGYKITPLMALHRFGSFRLSARIQDIEEKGYNIISERIRKNGKNFSQYFLKKA